MSAYIEQLNRLMAAQVPVQSSLKQRFVDWYNNLPEVARLRPFAMQEFEAELGTQGKYISSVLLGLGWQRKRRWSSRGQYHRYWVPPDLPEVSSFSCTDGNRVILTKQRDGTNPLGELD